MNIIELSKEAGFEIVDGELRLYFDGDKAILKSNLMGTVTDGLKALAALVRADLMKKVMSTCEAEYKRYDEMVEQDDAGHEEATAMIHLMRKLEKLK